MVSVPTVVPVANWYSASLNAFRLLSPLCLSSDLWSAVRLTAFEVRIRVQSAQQMSLRVWAGERDDLHVFHNATGNG